MLPGEIAAGAVAAARFPPNFLWGTAASAYQVEGAWNAGTGAVACDHCFKNDIALMKRLHQKGLDYSNGSPMRCWKRAPGRWYGRVAAANRLVD
jgi:hypothetical protein